MAYGTRASFETIREVAFGGIGAAYAAVGTALTDHARLVRFVNTTDVEVYISFDAATDQIRLAINSFYILDLAANKVKDDGLFLPLGTVIYQKRVSGAPSSGSLWIEVLYAQGGI
jgi:hypothetical protein